MTDKQPLDYASPPAPLVEIDSELARRVLKGKPAVHSFPPLSWRKVFIAGAIVTILIVLDLVLQYGLLF